MKLSRKNKKQIITKKGTFNKQIAKTLSNCLFDENNRKIYHTYTSGRGRYTSNQSAKRYVVEILENQGYKFKEGNDAPRGGETGNFIKLSKTAFNFMVNLTNEMNPDLFLKPKKAK